MIVEDVRIDREDEVLPLVRKQITDGTVWLHKHDQGNLDGLTRAVRDSGELRPAFARAIHQLLSNKNRTIRGGAVAFLYNVAQDIGAPALVDLLESRPELFYRVKPSRKYPLHYDDLAGAVLVSIGRTTQPDDARSIAFLREALKKEPAWEVAVPTPVTTQLYNLRQSPISGFDLLLEHPGQVGFAVGDRHGIAPQVHIPQLPGHRFQFPGGFGVGLLAGPAQPIHLLLGNLRRLQLGHLPDQQFHRLE
jgi:hypothetical protein